MDQTWLDIAQCARFEGVSTRAIEIRIRRGRYAEHLLDRRSGQGGPDGLKTYLHIDALSIDARALYEAEQRPAPPAAPETDACVATPETVADAPAAGRLPEADYWLTAEQAAQLLGCTTRHARRTLCTPANIQAGHAKKKADGGWRIHAHLLPGRALRDFYLLRGKPVPDYLLRQLPDLPLDTLPEAEREYLLTWVRLLNAFESFHLRQGAPLETSADLFCRYTSAAAYGVKYSPSTLIKKRARYQARGPMGLRVRTRGGKKSADMLPDAWDWLKLVYAQYNGNRSQAVDALMVKARDMGWENLPSKWTLMKRLGAIPPGLLTYYKQGKKAFDDTVLPSNLRDYEGFPAMYCWVSDHHLFDVLVIWPDGSVKRIWITVWQDMRSRKIMGMVFSDNPNGDTIALALYNGIRRYGLPQHILVDNGKDYRSRRLKGSSAKFERDTDARLRGVYEHLGITAHFALPYNAKSKPCERTFRTFKEQVAALLNGYVGGHIKERPARLEREEASGDLLTASAFEDLFRRWIDEKYHVTRHSGHGMHSRTPNEVHEAECVEYGFAAESHLRLLLLKPGDLRVYGRNGFQLFNQRYLVPAEQHAALVGQQCWLRYHPDHLDTIAVYDAQDRYVCDAAVEARSQLFDDEAALKRRREYNKIVKEAAKQTITASQQLLRTGLPPAERIGLSATPPPPAASGRPEGAVIRMVPDKTRPLAASHQGVIDLMPDADADLLRRVDDDFTRAVQRQRAANGDDDIPADLEQRLSASFSRLVQQPGGDQ